MAAKRIVIVGSSPAVASQILRGEIFSTKALDSQICLKREKKIEREIKEREKRKRKRKKRKEKKRKERKKEWGRVLSPTGREEREKRKRKRNKRKEKKRERQKEKEESKLASPRKKSLSHCLP